MTSAHLNAPQHSSCRRLSSLARSSFLSAAKADVKSWSSCAGTSLAAASHGDFLVGTFASGTISALVACEINGSARLQWGQQARGSVGVADVEILEIVFRQTVASAGAQHVDVDGKLVRVVP
ncbi:hypothetical protein ACH4TE_15040 [Streptomyces sioyaensis]|uniref:hypothetical protein n=1 Tax=Streptomyces sioyaensis TaxID=67364 RepID=UPI0037AA912C